MRYEKYFQKTLKWANILNTIRRFRILILSGIAVFLASVATFMGLFGMVYGDKDCPAQIVYGDTLSYQSSAMMGNVSYEYAPLDTKDWSTVQPTEVGAYQVRSLSKNVFGKPRYGRVHAFSILPKTVAVEVVEERIVYGDTPTVTASLLEEHSISCDQFVYDDLSLTTTKVAAEKKAVRILDEEGKDVTKNYELVCEKKDLSFDKRLLAVTVANKTGIYDATPLTFDRYEVSKETPLVFGDVAIAVFSAAQTEVGSTINTPRIRIFNDGKDVSANYEVVLSPGTLTVDKRPLLISSNTTERVYDGTPFADNGYTVTEGSLVEGHTLTSVAQSSLTDCGSTENLITLTVKDGQGTDVTGNYSILLTAGTLKVTKRPITFTSNTASHLYDGNAFSDKGYTLTEGSLVEGHTASVVSASSIMDKGSISNELGFAIQGASGDVTANYDVSLTAGTLTVTPRPIRFQTESGSQVYNGTAYSNDGHSVAADSPYPLVEGERSASVNEATITAVGSVENAMTVLIYRGTTDISDNYTISYAKGTLTVTKRPVTVTAPSYTKIYDGTRIAAEPSLSMVGEIAVGTGTEGLLLGHTLSALTEQTDSGAFAYIDVATYRNGISASGTTIVDEEGADLLGCYQIVPVDGTMTVNKRPVTVEVGNETKVYDDVKFTQTGSLTRTGALPLGDNSGEGLLLSHKLTATTSLPDSDRLVGGRVIEAYVFVGTYTHSINQSSIQIVDQSNNHNVTGNYAITPRNGTVTITPRALSVSTESKTLPYNGYKQYASGHTTENLLSAHKTQAIKDDTHFALRDVFDENNNRAGNNQFKIKVLRSATNVDVTDNYEISYAAYGKVEITPLPITVLTGSNSWVYDDTDKYESSCATDTLSPNPLQAADYYKTANWTTVKTVATNVDNQMDVLVYRNEGGEQNITDNYAITPRWGKLTVTPRPIEVVSSANRVYNGAVFYYNGIAVTSRYQTLVGGHTITGETTHVDSGAYAYIDVGEYRNQIVAGSIVIKGKQGEPVTDNYSLSYKMGTLTITARPVTLTAPSASKVYDGVVFADLNPFSAQGTLPVGGEEGSGLLLPHKAAATLLRPSTTPYAYIDAGSYLHRIDLTTVVITDGSDSNRDVTHNYTPAKQDGTLTITPRKMHIQTGSGEFIYDNLPHSVKEMQDISTGENEGKLSFHSFYDIVFDSFIEANEQGYPNTVTFDVIDETSRSVEHNYSVEYHLGKIVIHRRPVYVTTGSNSWVYDGQAHKHEVYTVDPLTAVSGVLTGDVLTLRNFTEVTDVTPAPVPNQCTDKITRAGKDVSANYLVTYNYGKLEITPRPITVTTESKSWEYDGYAHKHEVYGVVEEEDANSGLAQGHTVHALNFPSITQVGQIDNAPTIKITQTGGGDVTENYDVTLQPGTLTITQAETPPPEEGDDTVFSVRAEKSGKLYFRLQSLGNYNGQTFDGATAYGQIFDEKYSANYLTSAALEAAGETPSNVSIVNRTTNYVLPYYLALQGGEYKIQTSDVSHNGSVLAYNVETYYYDYVKEGMQPLSVPAKYQDFEQAYRAFVYEKYLEVPESTGVYLDTIIQQSNFSKTDRTIASKVSRYIQNAATYNLEYDTDMENEEDVVLAFLQEYKEGVCRHYAAAATLLFRRLGIPARYTVGYVGDVKANEEVKITAAQGHAWVEIYIDGMGWVNVEVTGGGFADGNGSGDQTTQLPPLHIKPIDKAKTYDGTPLTYGEDFVVEGGIEGFDDDSRYLFQTLLLEGYTYEAKISGSRTEMGTSPSTITQFTLYQPNGEVCAEYEITYHPGELTVAGLAITVTPYAISKTYDGTPLSYAADAYDADLPAGYTLELDLSSISLTNAGVVSIEDLEALPFKVFHGGEEVTNNVLLVYNPEMLLMVKKRKIQFTAGSATKRFDGSPLTDDTVRITFGSLAAGHSFTAKVKGSIVDVGHAKNEIQSVLIHDSNNLSVMHNYEIAAYVSGVLTVLE